MKDKAIKAAMNSIENRICHVYNQGYEDGFICGKQSAQIDKSTAYKAGLEAAWELARKLSNLGFNDTRKEIFGEKYGLSIDIIKDFSVDEVAAKIKDIPIRCRCEILHVDSPIKTNILYAVPGTETLRYDKIISDEIYKMGLDNLELQKKIFGDVMNGLAEQAKSFVEISVEKDIFNCGIKISGRLAVVRPVHDYHDIRPKEEIL